MNALVILNKIFAQYFIWITHTYEYLFTIYCYRLFLILFYLCVFIKYLLCYVRLECYLKNKKKFAFSSWWSLFIYLFSIKKQIFFFFLNLNYSLARNFHVKIVVFTNIGPLRIQWGLIENLSKQNNRKQFQIQQ